MTERKSAIELVSEIALLKKQNPEGNARLKELENELKARSTTEIVDADTELQFYYQNPLYLTVGAKAKLGINVPRDACQGIKKAQAFLKPLIALLEAELNTRDVNELKVERERLIGKYGELDYKRAIGKSEDYDRGAYMQVILNGIIAKLEGFRKSMKVEVDSQFSPTGSGIVICPNNPGKEPADG